MAQKIIIYLKDNEKPIVLTNQEDNDISELKEKLSKSLNSSFLISLSTETDMVILKPNCISAIHIYELKNENDKNYSITMETDENPISIKGMWTATAGGPDYPICDILNIKENSDEEIIVKDLIGDDENNDGQTIDDESGIDDNPKPIVNIID